MRIFTILKKRIKGELFSLSFLINGQPVYFTEFSLNHLSFTEKDKAALKKLDFGEQFLKSWVHSEVFELNIERYH